MNSQVVKDENVQLESQLYLLSEQIAVLTEEKGSISHQLQQSKEQIEAIQLTAEEENKSLVDEGERVRTDLTKKLELASSELAETNRTCQIEIENLETARDDAGQTISKLERELKNKSDEFVALESKCNQGISF